VELGTTQHLVVLLAAELLLGDARTRLPALALVPF
jgi:hypothetical protein